MNTIGTFLTAATIVFPGAAALIMILSHLETTLPTASKNQLEGAGLTEGNS